MYKANKIIDGLYQGGFPPWGDGLAEAGVDVLVLCAKQNQDADKYENVEVICAPGEDDPNPRILKKYLPIWNEAARKVADHVREGKKVLVTCMAGLNRSGMVTALALRELTGWSGQRIVSHISGCRLHALCNDTFAQYIIETFSDEIEDGADGNQA